MNLTHKNAKKFVPKLEMVVPHVLYSFTINPNDRYQYFEDPSRITRAIIHLKKALDFCSFHYNLYCEMSQPNDSMRLPRLHAHGLIEFDSPLQVKRWYEVDFNKLSKTNYFNLDTIEDIKQWSKYCKKNNLIMEDITDGLHHISSYNHPLFQ